MKLKFLDLHLHYLRMQGVPRDEVPAKSKGGKDRSVEELTNLVGQALDKLS